MKNRITIQFTQEQMAALESAANTIKGILNPVCVTLTPDQCSELNSYPYITPALLLPVRLFTVR